MCLIIVKPRGKALPDRKVLELAWKNNSDGFGIAYHHEGKPTVVILKGAMEQHEVFDLIAQVPDPIKANMVMHFRFATEGDISAGNCHPFPIAKQVEALTALRIECPVALAHNGIIPSDIGDYVYGNRVAALTGKAPGNKPVLSDTQQFIQEYLVGLGKAVLNTHVGKLIEAYTGSKFALLTPTRTILIGKFIHDKGLYYSNTSYKTQYYYLPATSVCSKEWLFGDVRSKMSDCDICGTKYTVVRYSEEGEAWVCQDCLRFFPDIYDTIHRYDKPGTPPAFGKAFGSTP